MRSEITAIAPALWVLGQEGFSPVELTQLQSTDIEQGRVFSQEIWTPP